MARGIMARHKSPPILILVLDKTSDAAISLDLTVERCNDCVRFGGFCTPSKVAEVERRAIPCRRVQHTG